MQPCSGEIPRGYVASREHEMGVRKQGEDDTNQIRKVVIANFQVRDLECKFLDTITNTFLLLIIGCRVRNLVRYHYSDDLVPERFRRDTS